MMDDNTPLEWFAYHIKRYTPIINLMNDEQCAEYVRAVHSLPEEPNLKSDLARAAFALVKEDYYESMKQRNETSEKQREKAKARWEKEKQCKTDATAYSGIPEDATACNSIPVNANDAQYNTEQNNTEDNITNTSFVDTYTERGLRGKPNTALSESVSHSLFNNEKERAAAEEFRNQWLSAKEAKNTRTMIEAKIGLEKYCGVTIDGEGNFKAMSA